MTVVAEAPTPALAQQAPGLRLRVASIADVAGVAGERVRTLTLADEQGRLLPAYVPGSHLVIECGERANAYSLIGDGVAAATYQISVLRSATGDGGSRWLHDRVGAGAVLTTSLPRSAFAPVAAARHHLLIAAGIGITPILSHARAAARWRRSMTVLFRHRQGHPAAAAHLGELRRLCGSSLDVCDTRPAYADRLRELLVTQPLGSHLYVCGPGGFTDDALAQAAAAGWPAMRLHTERFSAADLEPGRAFTARLADGSQLQVPAGVSLLDALHGKGIAVPNRCRQGVCGECRIPVTRGRLEHRDLFLTEDERAAGDSLMSCVSRGYEEVELSL